LLLASCIFYMAFIPIYILILFFTILIDYIAGIQIEKSAGSRRKAYLILSIIANVGVLAVFKYYNFFTTNVNELIQYLHFTVYPLPYLSIILPLGLSFHTFQAMSYTIEVYRGNYKAEKHAGIYALYVMYYPQLVAGPIERPQNIIHQLKIKHEFDYRRVSDGLKLMLWGLFKKVFIADRLSLTVNLIYNDPHKYQGLTLIMATIMFSIQIYCDFSGYTDIALGASKVMGIKLMENFRQPYFSKSVSEFWQRWHISLSSWFYDYLFNGIVVVRRDWGKWAIVMGFIITFLISGFWHGAGWTYIVWGLIHGICLAVYFLFSGFRKSLSRRIAPGIYDAFSIFLTFSFVCFGYIFFRANSLSDAFYIVSHSFKGLSSLHDMKWELSVLQITFLPRILLGIVLLLLVDYTNTKSDVIIEILRYPVWVRRIIYYAILFLIFNYGVFANQQFIYFQF